MTVYTEKTTVETKDIALHTAYDKGMRNGTSIVKMEERKGEKTMEKKKFSLSLTTQILIATIGGIVFGALVENGQGT